MKKQNDNKQPNANKSEGRSNPLETTVMPFEKQLAIAKLEGKQEAFQYCADCGYSNETDWWQDLADKCERDIDRFKDA